MHKQELTLHEFQPPESAHCFSSVPDNAKVWFLIGGIDDLGESLDEDTADSDTSAFSQTELTFCDKTDKAFFARKWWTAVMLVVGLGRLQQVGSQLSLHIGWRSRLQHR